MTDSVPSEEVAFSGKSFLSEEHLMNRKEYMMFVGHNKDYIEAIADRHPRYVVRMLANLALIEFRRLEILRLDSSRKKRSYKPAYIEKTG